MAYRKVCFVRDPPEAADVTVDAYDALTTGRCTQGINSNCIALFRERLEKHKLQNLIDPVLYRPISIFPNFVVGRTSLRGTKRKLSEGIRLMPRP